MGRTKLYIPHDKQKLIKLFQLQCLRNEQVAVQYLGAIQSHYILS